MINLKKKMRDNQLLYVLDKHKRLSVWCLKYGLHSDQRFCTLQRKKIECMGESRWINLKL